jgi:hypothetical protein
MSFQAEIERIASESMVDRLRYLETYHGIYLDIYTLERDVHSDVYGKSANSTYKYEDSFTGILISSDIWSTGPDAAGSFDEGFLYTSSDIQLVGKVIQVQREDNKAKKYRVEEKETLGTTTVIFTRYKLSSLPN